MVLLEIMLIVFLMFTLFLTNKNNKLYKLLEYVTLGEIYNGKVIGVFRVINGLLISVKNTIIIKIQTMVHFI
jgi:hypothetical protein